MYRTYIKEVINNLALALDQQQLQPIDEELDQFLQTNPKLLLDILHLFVFEYGPARLENEKAYYACHFLIIECLSNLRYALDKGWQWAKDIARTVQHFFLKIAMQPNVDPTIRGDLLEGIYEAKFPISEQLKQASQQVLLNDEPPIMDNADIGSIFTEVEKMGCHNPFDFYTACVQQSLLLPKAVQTSLIDEMLFAEQVIAKDTAILMLLHPQAEIRQYVLQRLLALEVRQTVSPDSLRRIICLRNWLPQKERTRLDKIIKRARLGGIECAITPKVELIQILASEVDGLGAQGLFLLSEVDGGFRLCGLLVKENEGIIDPWVTDVIDITEVKRLTDEIRSSSSAHVVTHEYLNKVIQHYIDVGLANNNPPAATLLEVAEVIGTTDWYAQPLDYQRELMQLSIEAKQKIDDINYVKQCIAESEQWLDNYEFTYSWYEADAEIDSILSKSAENDNLITIVIDKVLEPRRDKWAHRLLWMALWAKATVEPNVGRWVELLVITKEIMQKKPLNEIPLMLDIAHETITAAMCR